MQWLLAMDTCGAMGGIALVELVADAPGYRVAAERSLPGRETQERLMLAVSEVLAAASIGPMHVDVVGIVLGPGSFTGVRIGLAAAKGMAEALSLPVVGLSRLAVLAAQVSASDESDVVVEAWIDAGRSDVFTGRYAGHRCLGEAMLTGEDALTRHIAAEPLVVMEEALAIRAPQALLVHEVNVRDAVPLFVTKVRAVDYDEIALLDANYLRVPDAELARQRALATA